MKSLIVSAATVIRAGIKFVLKAPIHLYRLLLSPYLGVSCRYQPSCSAYALEALDRHGIGRGSWLTLTRLCRCHPWGGHGVDPVPDKQQPLTPLLK